MSTAVTPSRHTRLILDPPEPALDRQPYYLRRTAGKITAAHNAGAASSGVRFQPAGAWTLRPGGGDHGSILTSTYHADIIRASDLNLGTNWAEVLLFRAPTDLTGVTKDPSVVSQGLYAITKRVPAGSSWNSDLSSDSTARPKPSLPSAHIPMDRIAAGKTTYPENAVYRVGVAIRALAANPIDTLFTVYFGGPAQVLPDAKTGGEYCVSVRGGGTAILHEWDGSTWQERFRWQAYQAEGWGNVRHFLMEIQPYGPDSITFRTWAADQVVSNGGFTLFGHLMSAGTLMLGMAQGAAERQTVTYTVAPSVTGYTPLYSVTGPGVPRLDVRRDLRIYATLARIRYPSSGTLVDLPFWIPWPIPGGTVLTASWQRWLMEGTSLDCTLYRADNHAALTPAGAAGSGKFQSVAGVQAYYARFSLTADSAREQTPVLYGFDVSAPGSWQDRRPIPTTGGVIRGVSVTGPDITPEQETAHVDLHDVTDGMAGKLRNRSRIPCFLGVYNDAGSLTSILFQGEVARADASLRGVTGMTAVRHGDASGWREYQLELVGMWARLHEQFLVSQYYAFPDPSAPSGSRGAFSTKKVTTVIRELLNLAGFPDAWLDILDINLRIGPTGPASAELLTLAPGTSIGEHVLKLSRDILGMFLIWDPNSGPYGRWRLLPNPSPPYLFRALFRSKPIGTGKLVHHPNSYGPNEAFWEGDSFSSYVSPPECNYVFVSTVGTPLPDLAAFGQVSAAMYNKKSFDVNGPTADALSPDYLGRMVPLVFIDPTLTGGTLEQTRANVQWVCRRLYDQAAHARKWFRFRAPLLLVQAGDTARPRPLRIGDAIQIERQGYLMPGLIRSATIEYEKDSVQMASYECLAL